MVPGALFWEIFSLRSYPFVLMRIVVVSMAFIPAYGLFAFSPHGPVGALHALAGMANAGQRRDAHQRA
jgi:hypothetical protein